jgi:hypothetical protein
MSKFLRLGKFINEQLPFTGLYFRQFFTSVFHNKGIRLSRYTILVVQESSIGDRKQIVDTRSLIYLCHSRPWKGKKRFGEKLRHFFPLISETCQICYVVYCVMCITMGKLKTMSFFQLGLELIKSASLGKLEVLKKHLRLKYSQICIFWHGSCQPKHQILYLMNMLIVKYKIRIWVLFHNFLLSTVQMQWWILTWIFY